MVEAAPTQIYGGDIMTFNDLVSMTKVYTRDTDSRVFTDVNIKMFINQGIDRIKQHNIFEGMEYLSLSSDVPSHLPSNYHYILALFAASRLFDTDERFFEGTEKRNEFEFALYELIEKIESGNVTIKDKDGKTVTNTYNAIEYITDTYFNTTSGEA